MELGSKIKGNRETIKFAPRGSLRDDEIETDVGTGEEEDLKIVVICYPWEAVHYVKLCPHPCCTSDVSYDS